VRLRLLAVVTIALFFALAQAFGSAASLIGDARVYAASGTAQRPATTVLQEDNEEEDEEDEEDDDDADDEDSDNDEDDSADEDNTEDDEDAADDNTEDDDVADDEVDESGTSTGAAAGGPITDPSLTQPLALVTGTSTGADVLVATPGERVAVRMFSWMPAGVNVTIRPIDPSSAPAATGTRAGDLLFVVEAKDATGATLTTLPAEVNLAVKYADETVSGLDEQNLTLSRLDPATNQWTPAPKLVKEPDSNYLAASVTQLGTYMVSTP
jgi:hypothetical protein